MAAKFPTIAACDIAGINRQRLNEDIASGVYPCPPPGNGRVGRWWDEDDICALRAYSFIMNAYSVEGKNHKSTFSKRIAGLYAEGVLTALRSGAPEDTRLDFPIDGFNDEWTASGPNDPPSFTAPSGSNSQIATICFSLKGIRAQVRARVKQWEGEA